MAEENSAAAANAAQPIKEVPPETETDAAKLSAQAKKLYEAAASGVHIKKASID